MYPTPRYRRRKNKKCPNYQDLFSLRDIYLAEKVRATHEPGFSRIAICAPDQRMDRSGSLYPNAKDASMCFLTLKLKYAMEIWTKAALVSNKQNPDNLFYYWWLRWKENETSFRHLEYYDFHREIPVRDLLSGFWSLLESIADSGEIKVSEGIHTRIGGSDPWSASAPRVDCEIVVDAGSGKDVYRRVLWNGKERKSACGYPFDKTPKSYRWTEIKDMFIELTLDQLRLVQGRGMHICSALDKTLFEACHRKDLEGVRHAIAMGADVNALNEYGNSPIAETIEYATDHFAESDRHYTDEEYRGLRRKAYEKTRPIVEMLLEHGADIDLFGFGGLQPLAAAYWDSNPEMVRFLLEHGSNPNYNSYIDDITPEECRTCVSSTVLYCIYDEIDEYTPEQLEIEKLMYQYGGRIFNWGFSKVDWEYVGKYTVWLEPSKHRGPFLDNCKETIGDCRTVTVEKESGETETIDLSGVDGLEEWYDEYRQNCNDMSFDWNAWRERGRHVAKEIAKLLPDYVTLYYLGDSEAVFVQPEDNSGMYHSDR